MRKTRSYLYDQIVHEGTRVIKIGFKRDLKKVIDELKKEAYETIILEDIPVFSSTMAMGLSGVKRLVIHNAGIIDHGAIFDMPQLEELEVKGSVGRLDCVFVHTCSNLRKITIDANIFSSDKSIIFYYCKDLETVIIRGVFPDYMVQVSNDISTGEPDSNGNIETKYPFDNYRVTIGYKTPKEKDEIKKSLLDTSKWVRNIFGRDRHIDYAIGMGAASMWGFISDIFGSWTRAHRIRKIGWEYSNEKENPSIITLKLSGSYQRDEKPQYLNFYYASFYTPIFERYRRKFHLWKIAGKGTEIDRMIRLCRWVHDSIHHKGDSIPNVKLNLIDLMNATSGVKQPGNCLIQSICLNEALLSIGIKSRYIKGFQRESNSGRYHVFVSAWSKKLKKWIFLDPTYGAYVMDMQNRILSPSEIRHNLINDIPMKVNDEANYNGDPKLVKAYLKGFLAGNLYYLQTNTISRDSTEDIRVNYKGEWIVLTPEDEKCYFYSAKTITDDKVFWQPPE